ncbi:Sodium/hydrogen exchanger family-domain-containing protein [Truncatella angustata]|uniref:Sodium/hydrogen exchanger family-domain-containing protein n=1 Tax=Truncatella angustata TaxID=152316 RepID=A0A9P8ZZ23_9PEZI|nr:Sodium/hydrogen exchanger family-domain-containing protein [Truncatella angustata]KAH6656732.1 Sodium/hydrogen exchanger family-domain-containing protein [Truncatella angustata]
MPTLALTNFNIVAAFLGGFISLFGLVSYLLKENFYMSEALISLLAGVTFSPHAANLIRPLEYALGSEDNVNTITLAFSRLVLGVQLVLAGIQLPSRYLKKEWRPLSVLLGPVMTSMWLITSLLIWGLVPSLPFLHALAIGACVTPTDPVLSNVIVKGKFADHNVPKELQKIIIAESGANDGLGYPFLFFALYLIKYTGDGGQAESGGAGLAMGLWFGETWGYTIILSVIYGAVVGWLAKELLHFAERHKWVDRESFLVFALSLALFIVGTCGMIGSDDVLACFIAGNSFTWDDWFRLETLDELERLCADWLSSLQPTIDMLLNVSIFLWYGAVCPWTLFARNNVIPIYRLILLGILILLLRRLPVVFSAHRFIHQLKDMRQTIFMGFFGPVGVSGIFYLYITLDFLETLKQGDVQRTDVANMGETTTVIVWFVAICSVVVHGLSIPLGKLGFYLPRTISRTLTLDDPEQPRESFRARDRVMNFFPPFRAIRSASRSRDSTEPNSPNASRSASRGRSAWRIGGTIIKDNNRNANDSQTFVPPSRLEAGVDHSASAIPREPQPRPPAMPNRTIRFGDEAAGGSNSPSLEQRRADIEEALPSPA